MTSIFFSVIKVLIFITSMYGWGQLVGRSCCRCHLTGWAFSSTLGIALFISIGGVLNVFHIALPPVISVLLIAGIGMSLFFVYSSLYFKKAKSLAARSLPSCEPTKKSVKDIVENIIYISLLLIILVFLIMVLMPSQAFNYHDDFHVYLMWPLKMLQTGTLGGNPFDHHAGLSSLGAQSFMQGAFLALHSNIEDINAFDLIICLILILGIIKELGVNIKANIFFVIIAGILVIFINPQYANISSLYSGSLMMLGLIYANILLAKSYGGSGYTRVLLSAIPCGLFYAALLSLKITYIFVTPLFWSGSLLGSLILVKEKKQVLWAHLFCALIVAIVLMPWAGIHLGEYLQKFHLVIDGTSIPREVSVSSETKKRWFLQLFSKDLLFYGNTLRDYFLIICLLFFSFIIACYNAWRNKDSKKTYEIIPFIIIFLITIINYFLFNCSSCNIRRKSSCKKRKPPESNYLGKKSACCHWHIATRLAGCYCRNILGDIYQ
jgi:hypothetical protein